jgi:hypothetical protein
MAVGLLFTGTKCLIYPPLYGTICRRKITNLRSLIYPHQNPPPPLGEGG